MDRLVLLHGNGALSKLEFCYFFCILQDVIEQIVSIRQALDFSSIEQLRGYRMPDVFISYVEEDAEIAVAIANEIETHGFETWYYARDSVAGGDFLLEVSEAIDRCVAVIVIISPQSLGSHQVHNEIVHAYEERKRFIPVLNGISRVLFQRRQPVWRQALGPTVSITIPDEGVGAILPKIVAGLRNIGLGSDDTSGPESSEDFEQVPEEEAYQTAYDLLIAGELKKAADEIENFAELAPNDDRLPALRKALRRKKSEAEVETAYCRALAHAKNGKIDKLKDALSDWPGSTDDERYVELRRYLAHAPKRQYNKRTTFSRRGMLFGAAGIAIAAIITVAVLLMLRYSSPEPVPHVTEKPKAFGSLYISTQPKGATVYIEGIRRDAPTPARYDSVHTGMVSVRLTMTDRTDVDTSVAILENQFTRLEDVSMLQRMTFVNVSTDPMNAEVWLNKELVGSTPLTIREVLAGTHELRLVKPGHLEHVERVRIPGEGLTLERDLEFGAVEFRGHWVSPAYRDSVLHAERVVAERRLARKRKEQAERERALLAQEQSERERRDQIAMFEREITEKISIGEWEQANDLIYRLTEFDPAVGESYTLLPTTWIHASDMPTARSNLALANIDGRVYAVGGHGGTFSLEVYDPATDKWTRGPNMSTSRYDLAAAEIGGKLYVVGGTGGGSSLEVFDPATNQWTRGPEMPTGRWGFAAAVLNGKLHVVAGSSAGSTLEIFDLATNQWTRGPNIPTNRSEHAVAAIDGKLFAVGGGPRLDIYDTATNEWTRGPDMPTRRESFAVAVINDKLAVFGGKIGHGDGFRFDSTIEVYDPEINRWFRGPDMPTVRKEHAATAIGGNLYVVGGTVVPGFEREVHVFPSSIAVPLRYTKTLEVLTLPER